MELSNEYIDRKRVSYLRNSLYIIVGLSLLTLLTMNIWQLMSLLKPLLYCSVFSFVTEIIVIFAWKRVASKASESLPTFFMVVSGLRVILALIIMFIYYFAGGKGNMLEFILLFFIFYVSILLHHIFFFTKQSK